MEERPTPSPLSFIPVLLMAGWMIFLLIWNLGTTGDGFVPKSITAASGVIIALYVTWHPLLRKAAFTVWVVACVVAAFCFPNAFLTWGDFQLKTLIVPLIQLIMFGMGATLLFSDFTRVFKMPRAVLIGMALQFSIMPAVGFLLASAFGFEPAIAAGVILIGSCPGGVASNLMTYISKGNVALSVTMTACSTLVAPIMTPFLMKLFAGAYVEIVFMDWVINILKIIIVPIGIGIVFNAILRHFNLRGAWLDRALSFTAMFGICFIVGIIIASSRNELLTIGAAMVAVAIIHNATGYILGYGGARLAKLDESSCRTVAIEVGLQNGGMATALAINILKDPLAALGPAIFGPWMNVSGSMLASWWSARPPKDNSAPSQTGS